MSAWNPYYIAFAAAHGRRPADMLAVERETWPGGHMVGFQLWMSRRWVEWGTARGLRRSGGSGWSNANGHPVVLGDRDHAAFGGWLRGYAFRMAEGLSGPRSSQVEHSPACSIDKPVGRGRDRRYPCVCDCEAEARA